MSIRQWAHLLVADPALFTVERESGPGLVADVLLAVGVLRRRVVLGRDVGILPDSLPGEIKVEAVRHVAGDAARNQAVGVGANLSEPKDEASAQGDQAGQLAMERAIMLVSTIFFHSGSHPSCR